MAVTTVRQKPHPTYEHLIAFEDGRIFHDKLKAFLKAKPAADGYIVVCQGRLFAHRLVWEAFRGLIADKFQVDHIDCNRSNNELSNLQLLSPAAHYQKTLLDNPDMFKRGAAHRAHPVTRIKLWPDKTFERIVFESVKEAANMTPGANRPNIQACIAGRRPFAAGYRWESARPEIVSEPGEYWASPLKPEWRGIEVSNFGRIKTRYGNLFNGKPTANGYFFIGIGYKTYGVHQIICEVFHGSRPDPKATPDHIDRVPTNNRADNLKWATRFEQARNRSMSVAVEAFNKDTGEVQKFDTIAEASEKLNLKYNSVQEAIKYKRNHEGYEFRVQA